MLPDHQIQFATVLSFRKHKPRKEFSGLAFSMRVERAVADKPTQEIEMARRSGYVRIDVSDILDEVDDDDLLDEVAARRLTLAGGEPYDQDLVREAFNELSVGRVSEARVILDRLLNPKWRSQKHCAGEYAKREGKML